MSEDGKEPTKPGFYFATAHCEERRKVEIVKQGSPAFVLFVREVGFNELQWLSEYSDYEPVDSLQGAAHDAE